MMSGHTNHSQKHQARVGLSQTKQGALLYTFEGVCFQSPDSLLSHISNKSLQSWGDWNFFQPLVIQLFISWQDILLLSNTGLDYMTGIVFVACYNELIEHQEVLGTIRASYNSSAITLQIGSSLHSKTHHSLCTHVCPVKSCWFMRHFLVLTAVSFPSVPPLSFVCQIRELG